MIPFNARPRSEFTTRSQRGRKFKTDESVTLQYPLQ